MVKTSSSGSTHVYPFIEIDSCGPTRTHDQILTNAKKALEKGSNVCS